MLGDNVGKTFSLAFFVEAHSSPVGMRTMFLNLDLLVVT